MDTNQIYELVNAVNEQAFGESAVAVTDLQGLIATGDLVFSSATNTEAWANTLMQRIGKTIIRYRRYTNKLADMVLTDMEWGAILQKIKVDMPEAEADEAYLLEQGESIDHYKVNKLPVDQKLFVTRTPYQFHITIQRRLLREAFLTVEAMGAFISAMFGQVENKIETTMESLARLTMAGAVAEASSNNNQVVNLVTEFNTLLELTGDDAVTATTAFFNVEFLCYAIRRIKEVMDDFTDMSILHNDGSFATFTPYEDQRLRIISKFERAMEATVEWAAFNEQYLKLSGYTKLNFWQGEQQPYQIKVKKPSSGAEVTVNNLIAVLHDRDTMGVYQEYQDVLTTPVNAAGQYYNTYYHRQDGRALDTSENLTYFTLN